MPRLTPALRDAAMRWIADDPDPSTRDELQRLLASAMAGGDSRAVDELADRMSGPLRFGTAGLRGVVRAGPNGMNVAVVRRATAGLAAWLRDSSPPLPSGVDAARAGGSPDGRAAGRAEELPGRTAVERAGGPPDGDTVERAEELPGRTAVERAGGPPDGDTVERAGGSPGRDPAGWAGAARDGMAPVVVVGRDARHGSEAFAGAAAGVLAAAGFAVHVLPGAVPTPVLAFAVRHLGAVAGVQITASHNPPADNGYKVYLADGAQLVPPADGEIEAAIASAPAAVAIDVAWPGAGGPDAGTGWRAQRPGGARSRAADGASSPPPTPDPAHRNPVVESYLDRVAGVPRTGARTLRIALTPLHGVGGEPCVLALSRAGFSDVRVVAEQSTPDPDFPTVAFPNPEEPGATDAVLALAAATGADLAVALDPDADRCALGVPDGRDGGVGWRMLTGDETGVLLADHLLRHGAVSGDVADPLVATTVVSSSMLAAVAAAHGARHAETLTGFKWIVRGGPGLVYGYEEALGYCVDPDAVRDKDGIAACLLAADLAASLRAAGSSVAERLDELAVAHGVHRTEGRSLRMEPDVRDAAVARLRDAPPPGWDVDRPAPDVLRLRRTGERVVVRPSGTEPTLKAYLEVVEHAAGADDLAGARARAGERLTALRDEVDALLR